LPFKMPSLIAVSSFGSDSTEYDLLSKFKKHGSKMDGVSCRSFLTEVVASRDLKKANEIIELMYANDIAVTSIEYGILLNGYASARDIKGALAVKKKMDDRNILANPVVYGCLIDCAIKADAYDVAERLVHELEVSGVRQTVITCSLQIKLYGRTKNLERAMEVFNKMKELGLPPSATTFNSLLDTVARCNQMEHYAERLLAIMQEHNMRPDHVTFGTLIKGFALQGNIAKALQVFEVMCSEPFSYKPDLIVYNSLLDGCARSKQIDTMRCLSNSPITRTSSLTCYIFDYGQSLRPCQ